MRGCTLDTEIAAKERFAHVNVFKLYVNIIGRPVGSLLSREFASRTKKGTRRRRQ
jgi:hypothetical protein